MLRSYGDLHYHLAYVDNAANIMRCACKHRSTDSMPAYTAPPRLPIMALNKQILSDCKTHHTHENLLRPCQGLQNTAC